MTSVALFPLPLACCECGAPTRSYRASFDKTLRTRVILRRCSNGHRGKWRQDDWRYLGKLTGAVGRPKIVAPVALCAVEMCGKRRAWLPSKRRFNSLYCHDHRRDSSNRRA